ncbi:DUF1186 domain-containing protein, partial [Chlamydia trachomatis]
KELFYPISKAFSAGLIDTSFISMEDVETIIHEESIDSCLKEVLSSTDLINDTLEEMEKWLERFPFES